MAENLLSDGHSDRLMISGRRHGADTVIPSRQTTLDCSRQATLAITGVVDALEEDEFAGVWCGRRGEIAAQGLDRDVHVADDVAVFEGLGRGVVRYGWVGEDAGVEVGDLEIDLEVGVCGKGLAGGRVGDDGGDHVCGGGDVAHCWFRN